MQLWGDSKRAQSGEQDSPDIVDGVVDTIRTLFQGQNEFSAKDVSFFTESYHGPYQGMELIFEFRLRGLGHQ